MEAYKLEMKSISKSFGGVKALNDVSLRVKKGEIHALLGENGAGKSTLMKILSGAYQRDSGEILVDGQPAKINTPKDSKQNGIAVIYQELMLAADLTVAENIFIDDLAAGSVFINWKKLHSDTTRLLVSLGFGNISPTEKCGNLSVAHQQVVEICKNLSRDAKILVLDEPTSVLTFKEIEHLFEILKRLKANGISIIYISHRLEEIFKLCDTITVLKDGCYVDTVDVQDTTRQLLVNKMVGRELKDMFPARNAKIGEVLLRAEDLQAGRMVDHVSFEVHGGEVLGFSGLVGSGRTETMRAIIGVDKLEAGKVTYMGETVKFTHPEQAVKKKLGMLPEDRKVQGLLLEQPIRLNTTLAALSKVSDPTKTIIFHNKEKKLVAENLSRIQTKYNAAEDEVNSLSGGNQQKVVLARWIMADCKCIIFDEPTRGVDVGAKVEIYNVINALAEQGVAVIMISSEMPEIIGMCDRVVVMNKGRVTGELTKNELSEQSLIRLAMEV
ncbi:MAG: sugar ABC transporter ATP-binding protein [Christensenellaceae bacterium]|jgi:ribose transport system ATP-binding protein|nr:sugar ABC transporter ATP-binding protein [Christensenellaceae bacterium]